MTLARGFAMKQQQEEVVFAPRFSYGELLVSQQSKWTTELIAHVEHNDNTEIIEYIVEINAAAAFGLKIYLVP